MGKEENVIGYHQDCLIENIGLELHEITNLNDAVEDSIESTSFTDDPDPDDQDVAVLTVSLKPLRFGACLDEIRDKYDLTSEEVAKDQRKFCIFCWDPIGEEDS